MTQYCKVHNKYELALPSDELSVLGVDTKNIVIPLDEDPTSGFYRTKWMLSRQQVLDNLELIMKWFKIDQTKIPISLSLSVTNDNVHFSVGRNQTDTYLEWKNPEFEEPSPSLEFYDPITTDTSVYDVRKLFEKPAFADDDTEWELEMFFLPECWKEIQHKKTLAKWEKEDGGQKEHS